MLENKLDPEAAGYIGEKFNHFLPNALGIKPLIEYLVTHPDALWLAMTVFTIIEAIVGLLFILGFFTRLMSIGVFLLALGILLGSGWLGTTCLDEWQIGVLGIASGFTIFLSGGGKFSIDQVLSDTAVFSKNTFRFLCSGSLAFSKKTAEKISLFGAVGIIALTLFTNQVFHGGVWGDLHNLSVRPHITVDNVKLINNRLSFQVFRDEGADVYGSFLIGIQVVDNEGNIVFEQQQKELAQMEERQISNKYVLKVKPGEHSLIIPLGAKADLNFENEYFQQFKGKYRLILTDISGITWQKEFFVR